MTAIINSFLTGYDFQIDIIKNKIENNNSGLFRKIYVNGAMYVKIWKVNTRLKKIAYWGNIDIWKYHKKEKEG